MQIIIKKILKEGTKVNIPIAMKLQKEGLKNIFASLEEVHGRYFADDIFNEKTGEVYLRSGDEVTEESLEKLKALNIKSFYLSEIDGLNIGSYLRNTLVVDKNNTADDAVMDIYKF